MLDGLVKPRQGICQGDHGKVGERDHGNGTAKCTNLWIVLRETLQVQPEFLHVFTNRYAAVL